MSHRDLIASIRIRPCGLVGCPFRAEGPGSPPPLDLTRRQTEVLGLVAAGLTHKQAARRLGLGAKMVAVHLVQARRRTGCKTTGHLIAVAVRAGLV